MTEPLMFDTTAAEKFLSSIYNAVPGRLSLAHSTQTDHMAYQHFSDASSAVEWAADRDKRFHPKGIYFRCSTVLDGKMAGKRGTEADSMALPMFWADCDFDTVGHKPPANGLPLPPTAEAALRMLDGLPAPTRLVHSGGGLYPLWLFDEPVTLTDPEVRGRVKAASQGWQEVIGRAAAEHGWHYGTGVGDLARVLRLPGSVNRKAAEQERRCVAL